MVILVVGFGLFVRFRLHPISCDVNVCSFPVARAPSRQATDVESESCIPSSEMFPNVTSRERMNGTRITSTSAAAVEEKERPPPNKMFDPHTDATHTHTHATLQHTAHTTTTLVLYLNPRVSTNRYFYILKPK